MSNYILQFQPFNGTLDAEFLHELGKRKLNDFKLSDVPIDILGNFGQGLREVSP